MRALLLLLMFSILIASPAYALGPRVGQEQSQEITQEKEKARGLEKTKEKRKTGRKADHGHRFPGAQGCRPICPFLPWA